MSKGLFSACVVSLLWTLCVWSINASTPDANTNTLGVRNESQVVIEALQRRLREVSALLAFTRPISTSNTYKQQCACEDYCTGRCFSMMCAACPPDTFSFPGGESLCLAVGPLGTGLLCHVDPTSGNVTQNACCNEEGPTCWLPAGSCCASGDCTSCPTHTYSNNVSLLYPPLNRIFVNDSSSCLDI